MIQEEMMIRAAKSLANRNPQIRKLLAHEIQKQSAEETIYRNGKVYPDQAWMDTNIPNWPVLVRKLNSISRNFVNTIFARENKKWKLVVYAKRVGLVSVLFADIRKFPAALPQLVRKYTKTLTDALLKDIK